MESGGDWDKLQPGDFCWLEQPYLDLPPTLMIVGLSGPDNKGGTKVMRPLLMQGQYEKCGYCNNQTGYKVTKVNLDTDAT